MEQLEVGVIGTGWCGGIRAVTAGDSALVRQMHIAETDQNRLEEMRERTSAVSATNRWEDLVENDAIDTLLISATPESSHYPMAKAALSAGKHVLLEKPMSITLDEADELIELAEAKTLKFTVGYSQRFNTKQALAKRSLNDGSLGNPVSILVSRHIGRSLGKKIGTRGRFSPAVMEGTHDIDFALWCLEPRRPVRVYSQMAWGARSEEGVPDSQFIIITMDDGVVVTVGSGWSTPPNYPNASATWIEMMGTNGTLTLDATHRDIVLNTVDEGALFPLSTMPGEFVDHTYAGPMERETQHFLEAVLYDRPVMVEPRMARLAMEVYLAADLSAARNQAVELPLSEEMLETAAMALSEVAPRA